MCVVIGWEIWVENFDMQIYLLMIIFLWIIAEKFIYILLNVNFSVEQLITKGRGGVIKKENPPFMDGKVVKYKLYFHFEYLLNIDKKLHEIMWNIRQHIYTSILKTYVNNISSRIYELHMHIKCGNKRDINPKGIFQTYTHTFSLLEILNFWRRHQNIKHKIQSNNKRRVYYAFMLFSH